MYITFTKYTKRTKFGGYRNSFLSSVLVFFFTESLFSISSWDGLKLLKKDKIKRVIAKI